MNKLLRPFRKHQPDIDALSEHIDGRLSAARSSELEAHISTCTACTDAHAELLEARALLAALPEVEHPRSFRLRQADIEAPVRTPARGGSSAALRWAPACAAVSAVVFVVVLGADLASRESNNSAQFSSLESSERFGMTAADESADTALAPGVSAAERQNSPTTGGEGGGAIDGTSGTAASQAETSNPQDATEPTGAPPSGDAPVEGATGAEPDPDADATAAANAGGSNFVPPTATAAALGAVPPDAVPPTTDVDADVEQFSKKDSDDGNRNGFLFVEITAAATAVLAGAAYVAWRWMRRGNAA